MDQDPWTTLDRTLDKFTAEDGEEKETNEAKTFLLITMNDYVFACFLLF